MATSPSSVAAHGEYLAAFFVASLSVLDGYHSHAQGMQSLLHDSTKLSQVGLATVHHPVPVQVSVQPVELLPAQ